MLAEKYWVLSRGIPHLVGLREESILLGNE